MVSTFKSSMLNFELTCMFVQTFTHGDLILYVGEASLPGRPQDQAALGICRCNGHRFWVSPCLSHLAIRWNQPFPFETTKKTRSPRRPLQSRQNAWIWEMLQLRQSNQRKLLKLKTNAAMLRGSWFLWCTKANMWGWERCVWWSIWANGTRSHYDMF